MSAFTDCIKARLEAGEVTPEQLERVEQLLADAQTRGLSEMEMAELAEARTLEILSKGRRRAALAAAKAIEHDRLRLSHPDGPAHANSVNQFLAPDFTDKSNTDNVFSRSEVAFREFESDWADGIEALRSKTAGLRQDRKLAKDVIREAYGKKTGNAEAASIAKSYATARSRLYKRFLRAGGEGAENIDNVAPQFHSMEKIANVRKFNKLVGEGMTPEEADTVLRKEWVETITPMMDRRKMTTSDGVPLTDEQLQDVLADVYETTRSGGLNKMQEGQRGKGPSRVETGRRVLWFKDAESWLKYQEQFGEDNIFEALTNEARSLARKIGLLEILGPSPDAAVDLMVKRMELAKNVARKGPAGSKLAEALDPYDSPKFVRDVYNTVNGRLNTPANAGLATVVGGARSVTIAALIGSSAIISMTDASRLNLARSFIGSEQRFVLGDILRFFNPRSAEDRLIAARAGITMEVGLGGALMDGKYAMSKTFRKLPELVIRGTGLGLETEKFRNMAATDFLGHVSHQIEMERGWGDLPEALRVKFETRGFNAGDWDKLRKMELDPVLDGNGRPLGYINLRQVSLTDQRVGSLLHSVMLGHMEATTQVSNPRVTAALTSGTQAGTTEGEALRTVKVFSTFTFLSYNESLRRIWTSPTLGPTGGTMFGKVVKGEGAFYKRLGITSKYILTMTAMSAAALQFREISSRKDPRDMTDESFWYNALLQSGGLSIYGDFIDSLTGENRYGDSIQETLTGPVVRNVQKFIDIPTEATKAVMGKKNRFADAALDFAQGVTPGANAWPIRALTDWMIFENARLALDPDAARRLRDTERRINRETGQEFWLPPGGGFDEIRPPNLEAALGD